MDAERTETLVRLLTGNQGAIYRYIFALVPHEEDARDILQETNVALYRKFESYDADKPFLAWAYQFAYLEVLKHRDRTRRGNRAFSPEVIDRIVRDREVHEPVLEARVAALEGCLERLSPADRDLIYRRYQRGVAPDDLASQTGTSRRTLFRNLERIRRQLLDCITHHAVVEPA
jgi:RNA polymerase sigma-70 factor, ECF subfamily